MQRILKGVTILSFSNTVEEKLLLKTLISFVKKSTPSNFTPSDFINLNIDLFLNLIKKEGVSHIVYKTIIHNKKLFSSIPVHVIESLKIGYLANVKKNIVCFEGLKNLIRILSSKNIDTIILKGAALVETVYDDIGLRAMSDIDILIKLNDFTLTHETLISEGFIPLDNLNNNLKPQILPYLNTYSYQNTKKHLFIHLHWHLVNSTIFTGSYIYNIDLSKIFNEAISKNIDDIKFKTLSPHHQIIHLSEHALRVRHSFDKIILLIDIALTITKYKNSLDWERLINHAKEFKLDRMVYITLKLATYYFNVSILEFVILKLQPKKVTIGEKIFLKNAYKNIRRPGLSYLIHFSMNLGIRKKVYFIFRTLFPPKSITQVRYANTSYINHINRFLEIIKAGAKNILDMVK